MNVRAWGVLLSSDPVTAASATLSNQFFAYEWCAEYIFIQLQLVFTCLWIIARHAIDRAVMLGKPKTAIGHVLKFAHIPLFGECRR